MMHAAFHMGLARSYGRSPYSERGMTVIELVVVIGIIAAMFIAGALGLSALRGADVDASASIVSGGLTYVASLAVHENRTYRLILDMDQQRYWAEAVDSEDYCARFMPDDPEAGLGNEEAPRSSFRDDEEEEPPPFSESKAMLLKGKFEKGTNVSAVLTAHHDSVQSEGRAAIYFYPNGLAERSLIWFGLKDDDGRWTRDVTLELHSLGHVTRHSKNLREQDFDLKADEGRP